MAAIIFDMDGVLIDSEPHWQDAEIEVFGAVGVPLTREMCHQTTGMRLDATVNHWYTRHPWKTPSPEVVQQRVCQRVQELVAQHGQPLAGAVDLVRAIHARGLPLAVCSSSPLQLIESTCDKLAIRHLFGVLQSAEHCSRGKPHPEPYLATAQRLGERPERCLVFEDSLNGMRSARAAGMKVIGLTQNPLALAEGLCDQAHASLDGFSVETVLSLVDSLEA